jgi:hypothetical protein
MVAHGNQNQTLTPLSPGLDNPYEPVLRWLSEASYESAVSHGLQQHRRVRTHVAEWRRWRRAGYFPPSLNYHYFDK